MSTSYTQDDYKTRSIDNVHINPSIMEGEKFYPSILGPNRAVRIDRYSPVNVNVPTLSGSFEIPSTLSCFPGVWDASPQPNFTYQWYADAVPIANETENTLLTYPVLDGKEITCEVTATNNEGSVSIVTPDGITVSIIEPIELMEQDYYAIQGMNQVNHQNIMELNNMVASGMWVDNRFDIMTKSQAVVTGLQIDQTNMLYEYDIYSISIPTFLENANVINSGAETGDLTGWNTFVGSPTVGDSGGNTGTYFFKGSDTSTSTILLYQDVPVGSANEADVDNKLIAASVSLFANKSSPYDYISAIYKFYDGSGTLISSSFSIIQDLHKTPSGVWTKYESNIEDLPVGTRNIRVEVVLTNEAFDGIDTQFDDVTVKLYKY